jgi:hypothetical protein
MPESAIATGFVDFILSPEEIASTIVGIARVAKRRPAPARVGAEAIPVQTDLGARGS